jgi:hypothetical protein
METPVDRTSSERRNSMPKANSNGNDSASTTCQPTVHLILQGKGVVGKSIIASWLAEFLIERGQPFRCIDGDPIIEFQAPEYLRNVIRIITETGLRVYKELMPMKKEQLDLGKRRGLDSGLEDGQLGCRSTADTAGCRCFPRPDPNFWYGAVAFSKRRKL